MKNNPLKKVRAGRINPKNTMIFLIVFVLFAVGFTLMFRQKMADAAMFAAGDHIEDEVFNGGVARYPDAASFAWGIYIAGILFFGAIGILVVNTKASLEKIFLWIAVPLGIIYLAMMVPTAGPDEQIHYQRCYKVSNALLFRWGQMDTGLVAHFDYHQLWGHYNPASGYHRILEEFFQPLTDMGEQAITHGAIDYAPMYLPQAVGIAVGRLFGLGFLPLFYLGRLTNLLFYVLLAYHAIRKMPRYQLLLCMIALLPMNMHQAASYSYDAYVNGFSFLVVSLICRMAWLPSETSARKRISVEWKRNRWHGAKEAFSSGIGNAGTIARGDLWKLGMVILLWAPAKPVYLPLLFLLLLVPKEKFGSQGKRVFWCVLLMLLAFLATMASRISDIPGMNTIETNTMEYSWDGKEKYTLWWILQHPVDTLKLMIQSLRLRSIDWLYECLGSCLAGLSVLIPRRYMKIYLVLLLLCVLRRTQDATEDQSPASLGNDDFKVGLWHRLVVAAAGIVIVGLVLYTLILYWTHMGADVIEGVQGRYFSAAIILPFFLLDNSILVFHRNPKKAILIGGLMMHVATIMEVLHSTMMM